MIEMGVTEVKHTDFETDTLVVWLNGVPALEVEMSAYPTEMELKEALAAQDWSVISEPSPALYLGEGNMWIVARKSRDGS